MARGRWLDRPEFGRAPHKGHGPQVNPSREKLLATVRAHPNVWAKVAEYKGSKDGGKKRTFQMIHNDEMKIRRYVARHYPLEDWQISCRMVPNTWADRELRVMYRGTVTPEEAEALREARVAAYAHRRG